MLLFFLNKIKYMNSPCLISVVHLANFVVFGGFSGICTRKALIKYFVIDIHLISMCDLHGSVDDFGDHDKNQELNLTTYYILFQLNLLL